jgi:hypothetical protein
MGLGRTSSQSEPAASENVIMCGPSLWLHRTVIALGSGKFGAVAYLGASPGTVIFHFQRPEVAPI